MSREFPVQKDQHGERGTIPWSLAEVAYEAYSAAGHGSQSLERLAERGGFGWAELLMLFRGPEHYKASHSCASACWSDPRQGLCTVGCGDCDACRAINAKATAEYQAKGDIV